jgi:hypothetical protein
VHVLRRRAAFGLVAFALAAAGVAGCNGGAASFIGCPSVGIKGSGSLPMLLYPANGSTGVLDALPGIGVAFKGSGSQLGLFGMAWAGNNSTIIGPVVAAPPVLPSPAPTAPPGWTAYGVLLPPLSPRTTYSVQYTYPSSYNSCHGQQTATATIGQFTTQ